MRIPLFGLGNNPITSGIWRAAAVRYLPLRLVSLRLIRRPLREKLLRLGCCLLRCEDRVLTNAATETLFGLSEFFWGEVFLLWLAAVVDSARLAPAALPAMG